MNEFSNRLKLLREKSGLSLGQLEEKTGLAKSLLWRYEAGKSDPGLSALITLAEFFGVTLDWIAGNGKIDEVQHSKKAYTKAVDKCISKDIDPEELEQLIDIIRR